MDKALHVVSDQGENYWLTGDHVSLMLTEEQTGGKCTVAALTATPGHGPPPHLHHREHEMFYIVQGPYEFILNDTIRRIESGGLIWLPAHQVHGFRNASADQKTRAIVFAFPSGFDRFVRLAGDRATDPSTPAPFGEPQIARLMKACADCGLEMKFEHRPTHAVQSPAAGPAQRVFGQSVTRLLSAKQSDGAVSVFHLEVLAGAGFPAYVNDEGDEVLVVISGTCLLSVDGRGSPAEAGDMLYIPAGCTRRLTGAGPSPATLLSVNLGGHFEQFISELSEMDLEPIASMDRCRTPGDHAALRERFARHALRLAN